ncbi:MAG TPA: tetratricopeptide repeat protein, partial [Anaerolineales bacterium]
NLATRFDLLEKRVELYSRIADRDEQSRDLDRLDALAAELDEAGHYARAAGMRSSYHFVLGDYPETIKFAESVISLGRQYGEMDTCMVAYNNWAMALLRQSNLKTAMKIAIEGLELARQQENKYFQGLTLNTMGIIAHMQEDPDSAEHSLEEAGRLAREIGDRALLSKINTNLGNVAGTLRGDYSAARRYYEQGLSILEEQGDRYGQSILLLNLAWAAGIQGDFPASRAYNKQAVTYAREVGNPQYEAYALINLSAVASVQGDIPTAKEAASLAAELTTRIGDRIGESWALLNMGHAYMAAGEPEEAAESYQRCMDLRLELDMPGFEIEPMAGLIQAALGQKDLASASEHTEHILAHIERGGTLERTEEPLRIYLACYETLVQMKDDRARALLEEAGKLLDMQAARLPDESARQLFLNSTPWRRAIKRARENNL